MRKFFVVLCLILVLAIGYLWWAWSGVGMGMLVDRVAHERVEGQGRAPDGLWRRHCFFRPTEADGMTLREELIELGYRGRPGTWIIPSGTLYRRTVWRWPFVHHHDVKISTPAFREHVAGLGLGDGRWTAEDPFGRNSPPGDEGTVVGERWLITVDWDG